MASVSFATSLPVENCAAQYCQIVGLKLREEDPAMNISDHLPLALSLHLDANPQRMMQPNISEPKINWKKAVSSKLSLPTTSVQ